MATIPVPAIFVPTNDPRLFPSEEMLEKERQEAREKQLPPTRPILFTTVGDDPPENAGCKGKCDFANCECLYFAGEGGECARCKHANLYHRVKIRRVDLEAKAAADALKKMKHRRHIPTQKEIEEQKVQEENKPPEPVNTYPCEVADCECKRMSQPPGWDPATLLPKLCRTCKHAEMYHVKIPGGKKNKGRMSSTSKGKSGSSSSAASTARGSGSTARGGNGANSAKGNGKSGSGKKKSNKK